jgi:hypothetical protein
VTVFVNVNATRSNISVSKYTHDSYFSVQISHYSFGFFLQSWRWESYWIFTLPKLLINSFVVEKSWRCSQHFQQMLQGGIRCLGQVPTQVKRKNPGIRRWGIARDMTVTLQIHPKSQLLINSHQTSAAEAPNMAGMANRAYRPLGGTIYNVYVPLLIPLILCIDGMTITTGKHQARRFVHASCLRLANKH